MVDTAHKAASYSLRELSSWRPGLASADANLLDELGPLSTRSLDLTRNNGVAAAAVQTHVDNIVGTGLRLNAMPDYLLLGKTKSWADGWAEETEAKFRAWSDSTWFDAGRQRNFAEQTRLVYRTAFTQGDALALPLWLPERGSPYATCLQLVDPDRLSTPIGRLEGSPGDLDPTLRLLGEDSRTQIRGGVEIDEYGAPVRFHIRKSHPRDVGPWFLAPRQDWEAIPAYTPFGRRRVIHIFDIDRVGQSRGKPDLTAVMPMFKMLDQYENSELQAAIVNAMIAAFMETSLPPEQILQALGGDVEQYLEKRSEWQVKLQGGMIIPTFPGDKLSPFVPARPNAAYGDFTESVLRHIGTSLGLPLELLMKDFSKTNYSSARAALLEAWRFFNGRRAWLATHWADPVYDLWLEEAANRGEVEAPDFYANRSAWTRCEWIGDGRGWVDPLKEAQASGERRKQGVSTYARECAEQGLDWRTTAQQQVAEEVYINDLRAKAGLAPLPPGGIIGMPGQQQPQAAPDQAPPQDQPSSPGAEPA